MSRLLFAAARGARIEALDRNLGWRLSSHVPLTLSNDKRPYRIHPEDAHLQYGPISSELRKIADERAGEYGYLARQFADLEYNRWIADYADQLHRSLFLLFLAEALADEGL